MIGIRAMWVQTRSAVLTSIRDSRTIAVGIALPLVLLLLFNSIFSTGRAVTNVGRDPIGIKAYYVAGIAAYAIAMQCFSWIIVSLAAQREMGQLKRLQGTPAPAWTFIGSVVLRTTAFAVVMIVLLFAIGIIAFGVQLRPENLIGVAGYTLLGALSMTALGLAVATFMPTADMAAATGPLIALILAFISGVFIPVSQLPDWLRSAGDFFPLYHLADGLQHSVLVGGGIGLASGDVLLLLVWGAGGALVAARRFRWETTRS